MKKECRNCKNWKPVLGVDIHFDTFGNCQKIINGSDVRFSGQKLQTGALFYCKYFTKKEEIIAENTENTNN